MALSRFKLLGIKIIISEADPGLLAGLCQPLGQGFDKIFQKKLHENEKILVPWCGWVGGGREDKYSKESLLSPGSK